MRQMQLGLALVFLLVMSGIAWAGKEAYRLVISQDKELCSAMLKLINDDLREHGEIRYEDHEMFAASTWQPLSEFSGDKFIDTGCSIDRVSQFDIDNDGRLDTVVKFSSCFKSRLKDSLVFLNIEEKVLKTYEYNDMVKNSAGGFPEKDAPPLATYILQTPVPLKDRTKDKLGLTFMSEGVGGWIVINPFIYKSTAYLVITDRGVDGTSSSGEGVVIGKYKAPKELDEVCYFKQVPRSKKGRR